MTDERLLRQLRQDARTFQEEVEASVAEHAASDREFREALLDYGKQGHEFRVEAVGHSLVGRIVHVGSTLVRVSANQGRMVDISLSALLGLRRLGSSPVAGTVTTGHPGSMVARLREAAQTQEVLHVERLAGDAIVGRVIAVLDGAVEIETDSTLWLVPMGAIVWVWRC